MVLTGSAIRSVADIDRPGVRIGVGAGDAADLFLKRTLKNAQLKPNPGGVMEEALRQLNASEIDAYAANRQRLTEAVARNPGMRILPENFLPVEQSMVVVKGDAASVEFLNRFIDELRTSGFIQGAIDRAKLAGVDVAPKKSK
jgi:polar amino acid transport system substrate-binding protein